MLTAWSKLDLKAPAFQAKICCNRGIAVMSLVGTADVFFFGTRVIHGKNIGIKWNMTSIKGSKLGLALFQQLHRTPLHQQQEGLCFFIKSLTQTLCRWNIGNAKRILEVLIMPHARDCFVIAFAKAEKTKVTAKDIDIGYEVAVIVHLAPDYL